MSHKYDGACRAKSVARTVWDGQTNVMNCLKLPLGLALLAASALPAAASSSRWADSEGGRIRLVTAGLPDKSGRLNGVLHIQLKPSWKTYWRDPGASGVPPQIDVSKATNIAKAEFSYPAPGRHSDGYGEWAGYDRSVSLPVTFTLANPREKAVIEAGVFVGICQTICIPLQARLTVDPTADPTMQTMSG